jgi:hypothetical protein
MTRLIRWALICLSLGYAGNAAAETAEVFSSEYWADSDKSSCAIGFYGAGRLRDDRLLAISGAYIAFFDATRQPKLVIHVSAKVHSNDIWRHRKVISARFRFAEGNTEGMREIQKNDELRLYEPLTPDEKQYGQLAKMALGGSSISLQLDNDEIVAMQLPPFMSLDRYVRRQFEQCYKALSGEDL